jgi:hypothetical protein
MLFALTHLRVFYLFATTHPTCVADDMHNVGHVLNVVLATLQL